MFTDRGRPMTDETRCRHCGKPILACTWNGKPDWTHASGYFECSETSNTVAEPADPRPSAPAHMCGLQGFRPGPPHFDECPACARPSEPVGEVTALDAAINRLQAQGACEEAKDLREAFAALRTRLEKKVDEAIRFQQLAEAALAAERGRTAVEHKDFLEACGALRALEAERDRLRKALALAHRSNPCFEVFPEGPPPDCCYIGKALTDRTEER